MGRIGSKVASRARAFGMDVFFNDIKKKIIKKNVKLYKFKNKNYIYKKCDFLSLHVDLNKRTKHLINKSVLKKMKKDAILINTSRGSVINEKELTLFLIKNKKFRVGLDVFDRETKINKKLVKLKNVLATPHSGPSMETRTNLLNNIMDNIKLLKFKKFKELKKRSVNY